MRISGRTSGRLRRQQLAFVTALVVCAAFQVVIWNVKPYVFSTHGINGVAKPSNTTKWRKTTPQTLQVYNLNVHPQQQRQWQIVLSKAGISLTEKKEEAHVVIGNPDDRFACIDADVPVVYGGSMYNGVPQRRAMVQKSIISPSQPGFDRILDLARDGRSFSPWHFTNCKYWITKKESEAQFLKAYSSSYGLSPIAMPYFYDDVKVVDGDWNAASQSEINGYVTGLLNRFPDDFVKSWKVKKVLARKGIIVHMHGMDTYDIDPGVPLEDPEFLKSKFTLHLKVSEGTYWCNAVARSIAAGIPVITDLATYNIGLFDEMILHNVSGVILADINEIITYIETVPDSDYMRLRSSTREFGNKFRAIAPEKVEDIKRFFWTVYFDSVSSMQNQDVDCRPDARRDASLSSTQLSCSPPCCSVH
eukprot:Tamp_02368.p2 GENE.Tamp_02368~~Tamp_02368.p2  ORF type:complete len:418 (+),score=49.04 Tamp_02368:3002-4255(+)